MSRRASNLVKLRGAAEKATKADIWVSQPQRARKISDLCADFADQAQVIRLSESRRMVRRLGNNIGPLMNLCRSQPGLAPWLQSARSLRRLSRYTGAVLASGALCQLIDNSELNEVAKVVGTDAVRFALENPSDRLPIVSSAADIIAFIESEGEQTVGEYLNGLAPALASEIMCAAGLSYDLDLKNNAAARANALAAVIEKVTQ